MRYLILFALLLAVPVHAQTVNKEFIVDTSVMAGAWTLDTIATHWSFDHCAGCVEAGGFFNGTRKTAPIAAAWGGVDVAAVVLSYEWKRHVTNRYIHWLWRAPLLYRSEAHLQGGIGNFVRGDGLR